MKEFDNFINSEKAPKVLKCGETFCFQCIKKNYENKKIFCPICGKKNLETIENIPVNKCAIESVEKEILNNVQFLSNDNSRIYDYEFSIGLMGDADVGKTSINHYFYKGKPLIRSQTTLGFEFHYKLLSIKKKNIKIRLWDTAGQEVYRSFSMGLLKGVNAVLIVFSLTHNFHPDFEGDKKKFEEWKNADKEKKAEIEENIKEEYFANVISWYNQFTQINNEKETLIYLVGNKVDDLENRVIKKEDAINLAKSLSLKYFETSAITGENINRLFSKLCLDLMATTQRNRSTINLNEEKNKLKCC